MWTKIGKDEHNVGMEAEAMTVKDISKKLSNILQIQSFVLWMNKTRKCILR